MATVYDAIILGAGIGGLTLGYRLAKAGKSVLILEPKDRPGGVVTTVQQDGFLLEKGPNSFSSGDEIMALLEEIGLGEEAYRQPLREHDRFVWKDSALRKVPMGPGELLKTDILSSGDKLGLLGGLFGKYQPINSDVTLGMFFRQCLGDNIVDSLLKPFMAGVYASDADRISFQATLPGLYDAAQSNTRLFGALRTMRRARPKPTGPRKPKALVSFPTGLQAFPQRLSEAFTKVGGNLILSAVPTIEVGEGRRWRVEPGYDMEAGEADALFLTSGAEETANMIMRHSAKASDYLRLIEYAGLTVVHVGVRSDQLAKARNGFGFLCVRGHGAHCLGMIWSSNIFPGRAPDGHMLLTCFYGGEIDAEKNEMSDAAIVDLVREDLKKIMGFAGGDIRMMEVTRWERALPIFRVGHVEKLNQAMRDLPEGMHLLANYVGSVSMPGRVEKANKLAADFLNGKAQAVTG